MLVNSLLGLLRALLISGVFLLIVGALFIGVRIFSYEQVDDEVRLANKQRYLQMLSKLPATQQRPNIVFVLYDDLGYGDIGPGATESQAIHTPHLDKLARQGVSFTNFYAPAPVCTPSRAGFLTGRLPLRAGLPYVVFPTGSWVGLLAGEIGNPKANNRLPAEEITLPDILQAAGYRTGMVGKWHLGDRSPSLPNDFGFDDFFGALYSNDMQPFALYRNQTIAVQAPADQRYLSRRYSDEVVNFIAEDSEQPFFLYLAHNFPHEPLMVHESRQGRSKAGLYGDVVEELDEGIGELLATLQAQDKLQNTLIIISSDNGPWFVGSAGQHRGRKGSTFDGGMRVPFIVHWPAAIAGGRQEQAIAMGTDLLPTILELLSLPAPTDRLLDGRSLMALLNQQSSKVHDYLYLLDGKTLMAVREQNYKYRAAKPLAYGSDELGFKLPVPQSEWLFDLTLGKGESYNSSAHHPDVLSRLQAVFAAKQQELNTNPRGWL